jgi:exodeoxyribonuclease-3
LKLTTFNINGIRARLPRLVEWLDREKPDVVCLQELKCADESLPIADIEAAGYGAVWHGQKGFNGVAILARGDTPKLRRMGLPGDPDDTHSRYIEAEACGLVVASIYLPNGNPIGTEKFSYKLAWMEAFERHVRERLKLEEPLVVAGDYNVIPTPMDAKRPDAWVNDALFQPQTRSAYQRLTGLGLTDAIRACHPGPGVYTFWDYQAGAWQKDDGIRIDHLLLSPQAADRMTTSGIDRFTRGWEKPSDHVPAWVELR